MAVYMLHSLREYIGGRYAFRMGFARMIGVDKAMGDPNTFGASIIYALPFVVPFWNCQPSTFMRVFLGGYVSLSVVCIGLTGSRSAFVGLLLWGLIMLIRSRWRWSLGIIALACIPVLWGALPDALQNRFETIVNPEVGPANARESAQNRLEGLEIGLKLWAQYPATGCGPGAWKIATGRKIESHNLYGQIVGETGTLGLVAFSLILIGFWFNLRNVRLLYREHPEWGRDFLFHVTTAVAFALFLLLFEGNFGHNLFRYSWLWYGSLSQGIALSKGWQRLRTRG